VVAHERAKDWLVKLNHPDVVIPDEVVSDRGRTITLGGTTLELHYVGRNHSDNTLVMRLPKEKIIFTVDWVPVGAVPGLGMIDSYPLEYEASLKKLLAMDWERLIPGHPGQPGGRLGTKQDVQDLIALLREASADAEKEVTLAKYASWPGYQNRRFLIQRYCALWGRGF
jgi:glyoxylase-like metal-dependent hydrolase (beta-lactamase superfamily II)